MPRGGVEVQVHSFFKLCARWERDPVQIVNEARWAPRPVWAGAENLAPADIRSWTAQSSE